MLNLIAMRTEELVPLTTSKESTAIMKLRSKSRVYIGKAKSLSLSPISYSRCHQVEKPTVQLPTSPFADVLLLGLGLEMQVLEDQNGIRWNPFTELSSGFLTERPVLISGFPGQPFQHSTDTPRIPVLCLLPGEFGLKTRANLARFGVADGQVFPTDEQGFLVSGSDQSIVHPEVDADRDNALGVRRFDGYTEKSLSASDTKAVNALGRVEVLAKVVGDFPADLLSPLQGRDGKATISAERKVFGIEEEGCRIAEDERTICWFAVGLGRSVSCGSCSDGIATHLRGQGGLSLVVDRVMQFKSAKGFATVETNWADGFLVAIELQHSIVNKGVLVEDYRYGSLHVHMGSI